MSLFESGVRPAIDAYLSKKSEEVRSYGDYWSASSAGYCMRLNILKRLRVPAVPEIQDDLNRTTRVFEAGHIFHEWVQRVTKEAGLSIAQELELQDEGLMVRGHIDDLVLVKGKEPEGDFSAVGEYDFHHSPDIELDRPILYDYKTAHSASFDYKKNKGIGHYHSMQLATYMYMLRKDGGNCLFDENVEAQNVFIDLLDGTLKPAALTELSEGRILHISKDDLRLHEDRLEWSPAWEKKVVEYWSTINGYWKAGTLPRCTCLEHDGGFLGKRSKKGKIYNPYFHNGQPCSETWVSKFDEVKSFIKKGVKENAHIK